MCVWLNKFQCTRVIQKYLEITYTKNTLNQNIKTLYFTLFNIKKNIKHKEKIKLG